MKGGEVAGQTDFFYGKPASSTRQSPSPPSSQLILHQGFGTLWATHTQVSLRSCGGGITAWKGSNTTFPNKYGVYIVDSSVTAANSSIAPITYHRYALGRPWNSQMRAIFANTYMDASILPTGYIDWNPLRYSNLTLQAEFENSGQGLMLLRGRRRCVIRS
jgi:Pectinesterase